MLSLRMGPKRVLTLRRGLRHAGLRHLSWSASNLYFRSIHTSIREEINILGSPGERLRNTLLVCRLTSPLPQKTKKTTSRELEKGAEDGCWEGHVTSWWWKLIHLSLCGWFSEGTVQKFHVPICPFTHNAFSSNLLSHFLPAFIEYSISSFSLSFRFPCGSLFSDTGIVRFFFSPCLPSPVLGRSWLGPFYGNPITDATLYNHVRPE